ncbi:PCRF domain protein, partial [Vibrio parahaemolyticus V-223/04]
NTQKSVAGALK